MKVVILFLSAITIPVIGKHVDRKELRERNVLLPSSINSVGDYCLNPDNIAKFVRRIGNPNNRPDSSFVCAFVAFQLSKLKHTKVYTNGNVDKRFQLFTECLIDTYNYNKQQPKKYDYLLDAGLSIFCDMTEKEKEIMSGGILLPDDECEELNDCPTAFTAEDLERFGVKMPPDSGTVSSLCVTSEEEVLHLLANIAGSGDRCEDFVCAFVAFQLSPKKLTAPYTSRNVMQRFSLFKECVVKAHLINSQSPGWSQGINQYCDMENYEMPDGTTNEWRDEVHAPAFIKVEDLEDTSVVVPSGYSFIPAHCLVHNGYTDMDLQNLADLAAFTKDDNVYLCAFVRFQTSYQKETPAYTKDTVERRFALFRSCVDENYTINMGFDEQGYRVYVDFMCDMEESEKMPLHNDDIVTI